MTEDNRSGHEITESIERNSDLLSGRAPRTAEIKMPAKEHLIVQLVPLSLVKRVEELNSDSDIFKSIFWTLVGVFLGVITSLVLNGVSLLSVDKSTWVIICALVVGIVVFFILHLRMKYRIDKVRKKLYQDILDQEYVS